MMDLPKSLRADREELDRNLFDHLKKAIEDGNVLVCTNFDHLNRRGSPSFSPFDNVAPLLACVLMATGIVFFNLLAGIGALIVVALFYTFAIRPWIAHRLNLRTRDLLLVNKENWNIIWAYGGVVIVLTDNPRIGCTAPGSDWRGLARMFLRDGNAKAKASGSSLMPGEAMD